MLEYVFFGYWHCPRSMRSRVYVTVRCPSVRPSVCLSRLSITAAGLLMWARRAGDIVLDRSRRPPGCAAAAAPQHGAQQQMRAVSRRQPTQEAGRCRLVCKVELGLARQLAILHVVRQRRVAATCDSHLQGGRRAARGWRWCRPQGVPGPSLCHHPPRRHHRHRRLLGR